MRFSFINKLMRRALLAVVVFARLLPAQSLPDDSLANLLKSSVENGRTVGAVLGILEPDGKRRIFSYGSSGSEAPLNDKTMFEIGSITKVFTATVVADMARRGELSLTDPIAKYLPQAVIPTRNGKVITIFDVVTHHSGFPRMPTNFNPADAANPFADYTVQQMYDFAAGYTLPRDPGASFEYSNYAMGLLAHALAFRGGKAYEDLLNERILSPLQMRNTAITLTPRMQALYANGFKPNGEPTSHWDLPSMLGAGAMKSNVDDLLTFASALLSKDTSDLYGAMREAMKPSRQTDTPDSIGLGWIVSKRAGHTITWHNGGTGGFRTFIGLDRDAGRAVVLLTNMGGPGMDDVGMHALVQAIPIRKTPLHQALNYSYRHGGMKSALERYQRIMAAQQNNFIIDVDQLNNLGYFLMAHGTREDAITFFKMNAEAYPDDPNPFDSLAEALENAGRIDDARAAFRRAVEVAERKNDARLATFRDNLTKFEARHR